MSKKLYREREDKAICGVCGGLAKYFDIDVVIIRLLAVILGFASVGTLLVGYIVAALVIPEEPIVRMADGTKRTVYETTYEYKADEGAAVGGDNSYQAGNSTAGTGTADDAGTGSSETIHEASGNAGSSYEEPKQKSGSTRGNGWIIGLILIGAGIWWLLNIFVPYLDFRIFGAALLILLGIVVLVKK